MQRLRPYLPLLVVLVIGGIIVANLTGRKVSAVFSNINSGLSVEGGSIRLATSVPVTNNAAYPVSIGAAIVTNAPAPTGNQQNAERLVVKNAQLSIQVADVAVAEAAVRDQVNRLNGYVITGQTSGAAESLTAQITFRVPAANFDAALTGVQGLATKVVGRTISGDDVTQEYVDSQSQLRNLEATRDRLLALLAKADQVQDALGVNSALQDVQGQIEQLQGRIQYLKGSAALSLISVSLAPIPNTPIVRADQWQPLQIARGALANLIAFGQRIVNVAIVMLVWTPVWLPLLLLGLWVRRKKLISLTSLSEDRSSPRSQTQDGGGPPTPMV